MNTNSSLINSATIDPRIVMMLKPDNQDVQERQADARQQLWKHASPRDQKVWASAMLNRSGVLNNMEEDLVKRFGNEVLNRWMAATIAQLKKERGMRLTSREQRLADAGGNE